MIVARRLGSPPLQIHGQLPGQSVQPQVVQGRGGVLQVGGHQRYIHDQRESTNIIVRYQPWNNREKQRVFDVPGIRVDVRLLPDKLRGRI